MALFAERIKQNSCRIRFNLLLLIILKKEELNYIYFTIICRISLGTIMLSIRHVHMYNIMQDA